jgi:hypothetical protein
MTRRPDPMGMGEGFFWWGVVTLIITLIGPWFG